MSPHPRRAHTTPVVKIADSFDFEVPARAVWDALLDPAVLADTLPGCEKLERTAADAYAGTLEIKIGPVKGTFKGTVALLDIVEPERFRMEIDGKGAQGFVKATASLELVAHEGRTTLRYAGDAKVGGRIASVGQRLMDSSARAIAKQSLTALHARLKAEQAARAATSEGAPEARALAAAAPSSDDEHTATRDPPPPAAAHATLRARPAPNQLTNAQDDAPHGEHPAGNELIEQEEIEPYGTEPAGSDEADAPPGPAPADKNPAYKKMSQAEFAAAVAKDVAEDVVSPSLRRGLVALLVLLAIGIVYLAMR